MKTTSTEAKRHLGALLETAQSEPVIIEKFGKPVAVLLGYPKYKAMDQAHNVPVRKLGLLKHIDIDIDELLNNPIPGIEDYQPQ